MFRAITEITGGIYQDWCCNVYSLYIFNLKELIIWQKQLYQIEIKVSGIKLNRMTKTAPEFRALSVKTEEPYLTIHTIYYIFEREKTNLLVPVYRLSA